MPCVLYSSNPSNSATSPDANPASRFLIDLNSDSNELIHPLNYPSVPLPEDRLWIPGAYVPLFEKAGWVCQQAPV
jgi:hypothetical protein